MKDVNSRLKITATEQCFRCEIFEPYPADCSLPNQFELLFFFFVCLFPSWSLVFSRSICKIVHSTMLFFFLAIALIFSRALNMCEGRKKSSPASLEMNCLPRLYVLIQRGFLVDANTVKSCICMLQMLTFC